MSKTSPPEVGYSEFSRLLERSAPRLFLTGIGGSQGKNAVEGLVSGSSGRLSYAAGGCRYNDDGFRKNQDYYREVFDAYIQYAATNNTSVQFELSRGHKRFGDVELDFSPASFSVSARNDVTQDSGRLGLHFTPSSSQHILLSAVRAKRSERFIDGKPGVDDLLIAIHGDSTQIEAQYLSQTKVNLIAGMGYTRLNADRRIIFTDYVDPFTFESNEKIIREENNAYGYGIGRIGRRITLTAGLSYNAVRNSPNTFDRLSPKFGIRWEPMDTFSIRAAAFQSVKRNLTQNQTVEPTQIAGFNQFYDDTPGTRSINYGIGFDAKPNRNVFTGFEVSQRKLDIPVLLVNPDDGSTAFPVERATEQLARVYVYWIVSSPLTVSFEPTFEAFKRSDIADPDDTRPSEVITFRAPLTGRLAFENGFFASTSIQPIRQKVDRLVGQSTSLNSGTDVFTVVDATFGWRLPKRYGVLSIEGRNLTDQEFYFRDENFRRAETTPSSLQPYRSFWARLSLYF